MSRIILLNNMFYMVLLYNKLLCMKLYLMLKSVVFI